MITVHYSTTNQSLDYPTYGHHSVTVSLSPCSLTPQTLLTWINDVLEGRRIIVRDIVEDIYDGQVLGELLGKFI